MSSDSPPDDWYEQPTAPMFWCEHCGAHGDDYGEDDGLCGHCVSWELIAYEGRKRREKTDPPCGEPVESSQTQRVEEP